MIHFQENPLGLKATQDLVLWLSKPEAQTARLVVEAKITAHEVEAIAFAAEAMKAKRDHTFQADELMAETVRYRHFLEVMQELASGKDLYTGQISIGPS